MIDYGDRSMCPVSKRKAGGFTLIELMIVVAIVAIIAAIAVPSYQESVRKSRRAQAKADMIEYAQMAERHYTVNNSYATFALPADRDTPQYDVQINANATTFTITATPQGGQAEDRCGTLTVDQAGRKTRSTSVPERDCW